MKNMANGARDMAICEAYKSGEEIETIAARTPGMGKLFLSVGHVRDILKTNNIPIRKEPAEVCPPPKTPGRKSKGHDRAAWNQEIIDRRNEGYAFRSIAAAFGIHETVAGHIYHTGGKISGRLPDPQRDAEICDAYANGAEPEDLAVKYGVSVATVNAKIKKHREATQKIFAAVPKIEPLSTQDFNEGESRRYRESLKRRLMLMREIGLHKNRQAAERELCRRDVVRFINNWGWTFDPRRVTQEFFPEEGQRRRDNLPAWMPFDLFPRQIEMIRFIEARLKNSEEGLIEKSRDIGFTWIAAAFALHRWTFVPGFQSVIGSHLETQVDSLGDPSSIFEKIRLLFYKLPEWLHPKDFYKPDHDNFLRFVNPENGNSITGAAGDQIGRGGRATLVIVDEAAHVERADRVDASASATSNCRIWASSVNGLGNLFARKRHGGSLRPEQIFTFHWRDDPRKTEAWAEQKKRELSATPWAWAAEYEIDYSASLEGVCIPGVWVQASRRLKGLLEARGIFMMPHGRGKAGLDVGGGKAQSVFIVRRGPVVEMPTAWGNPDTTQTAYKALGLAKESRVAELNFDSVQIGQGVASILALNNVAGLVTAGINTGTPPSMTIWEDGENSRQKFQNLRAEIWWLMREAFKLTWEHVNFLEGAAEDAVEHDISDLVSLPIEATELANQLSLPRSFRNERGKIVMESKVQMAARGVASPDQADALALTYVAEKQGVPFIMPIIEDSPRADIWAPSWS